MIPLWGHSQVPVVFLFRLQKYFFFVNSLGEKAPSQTKHSFASGVGSFQQLPYLSPYKDCKEAGFDLCEICLAQLYKSPPTFSQLNFTSICSQSIVEFSNTSTGSWHKNTVLVGLNMACMVFDMPETLLALLRQKYVPCWRALWEAKAAWPYSPLMHTDRTAPLGLETVGHLWSKWLLFIYVAAIIQGLCSASCGCLKLKANFEN